MWGGRHSWKARPACVEAHPAVSIAPPCALRHPALGVPPHMTTSPPTRRAAALAQEVCWSPLAELRAGWSGASGSGETSSSNAESQYTAACAHPVRQRPGGDQAATRTVVGAAQHSHVVAGHVCHAAQHELLREAGCGHDDAPALHAESRDKLMKRQHEAAQCNPPARMASRHELEMRRAAALARDRQGAPDPAACRSRGVAR
eukprot:scaffold9503_cov27-Tisochrysis_lutea.AAC.6